MNFCSTMWTTNCLVLALMFITTSCINRAEGCFRCHSPPPEHVPKINVRDQWFVDTLGRVRLFHGFNSVTKQPPWYSQDMLNDTKLDLYKSWGFNVVRLGVMWAGVEPEEGRINHTYLGILEDIVLKLRWRDIYVILDLHQDVLSSMYGSYDGVPRWLVEKIPPSPHPYPWPLPRIQQWADGYLTQAVGRAFQAIYLNIAGTGNYVERFWKLIARRFKDYSNVLGYELMNEPWAGDIYDEPSLLLPNVVGRVNLQPFYNRLNNAIRHEDINTIVFYEPVTWGVYLTTNHSGTGFTQVPGGVDFQDRSALSYHHYCWLYTQAHSHGPYNSFTRSICDKVIGPKVIPAILRSIQITGGGSFLTEFGLCEPDGNKTSKGTIECEFILHEADRYLQSWTYWDSRFFGVDGQARLEVVRPFARVYVRAVAGEPISMTYYTDTHEFLLFYNLNPRIPAPTEIVVPVMHYPGGFSVQLPDGMTYSYRPDDGVLLVKPISVPPGPFHVSVNIVPNK